jgi:hypothetical protein
MLRLADTFGVPAEGNTNPGDSIRNTFVETLEKGIEEAKRKGVSEPVIFIF